MNIRLMVAAILILPVMAFGQTAPRSGPVAPPPVAPAGNTAPGFPFPGGFHMPAGVLDHFWDDPAVAGELRLTGVQRKQLQDATLTQQLSMIDGGADALKALARLSALFEADQLDDASYKRQLNNLSVAVGKLVQDVGEMVATPRRVLTAEQWGKLRSLQRAKQAAIRAAAPSRPQTTKTPPAVDRP